MLHTVVALLVKTTTKPGSRSGPEPESQPESNQIPADRSSSPHARTSEGSHSPSYVMFSQSSLYLGSTTLHGVIFLGTGSFHLLLSFPIRPPYLTLLLLSEHPHCALAHARTQREAAHHGHSTRLLAPAAPTLPALLPDCINFLSFFC